MTTGISSFLVRSAGMLSRQSSSRAAVTRAPARASSLLVEHSCTARATSSIRNKSVSTTTSSSRIFPSVTRASAVLLEHSRTAGAVRKKSAATDLNADNMAAYHESHHHHDKETKKKEWTTMFNGKIPVLCDAKEDTARHERKTKTTAEDDSIMYGELPRTSVLMELHDRVGVLHDVLRYFWKYDVNICRIESRPIQADGRGRKRFDFFVDLEGSAEDANVAKLLDALRPLTDKLLILDEKQVHWFPRHISELDLIADRTLDAGIDLEADHPGFRDMTYRARRAALAEAAKNHRWDRPIERIDYTPEETNVWRTVWDKMTPLWEQFACKEYKYAMQQMKDHCGYGRDNIPQQQDISEYLHSRTGFRMRPVAGLLSSRDFLNGLAFRVFFSTQYIRHHSKPLYTPEPDICHELLGHAPMFADRDFADFSQEIGLASLGASDEDVDKLARCYWHSVEFGLCREDGENKAYGAGLLSSFGELEYACGEDHPGSEDGRPPRILPWDPEVAAKQEFPITTYQPVYFLAESLQDAKQRMRSYCEDLPRPFFALHNAQTDTIHIDRPVRRTRGVPDGSADD